MTAVAEWTDYLYFAFASFFNLLRTSYYKKKLEVDEKFQDVALRQQAMEEYKLELDRLYRIKFCGPKSFWPPNPPDWKIACGNRIYKATQPARDYNHKLGEFISNSSWISMN